MLIKPSISIAAESPFDVQEVLLVLRLWMGILLNIQKESRNKIEKSRVS